MSQSTLDIPWYGIYWLCYGHAILDNLYPLFLHLKKLNFPNANVTMIQDARSEMPAYVPQILTFLNCSASKNIVSKDDVKPKNQIGFIAHDAKCQALQSQVCKMYQDNGNQLNVAFVADDSIRSPELAEYVNMFTKHYDHVKQERLVTISLRYDRKITNLDVLCRIIEKYGYAVEMIDFSTMSIEKQIIQMRRTQILIGSYGSNLVNGIFLPINSKVIVCWPNPDVKQFWPRRHCVIHQSILLLGHVICELDKTYYDQKDDYNHLSHHHWQNDGDIIRDGNVLKLNPSKNNVNTVVNYPGMNYHLLQVNFTVDPEQFTHLFEKITNNTIVPIIIK